MGGQEKEGTEEVRIMQEWVDGIKVTGNKIKQLIS